MSRVLLRHRGDDELIREQPLPQARGIVRQPFGEPHQQRSFQSWKCKAQRHSGGPHGLDAEAALGEQLTPAIPSVKVQMRTVEKAAILFGKVSEQHVEAEVKI